MKEQMVFSLASLLRVAKVHQLDVPNINRVAV
jgi:hypothetical protein